MTADRGAPPASDRSRGRRAGPWQCGRLRRALGGGVLAVAIGMTGLGLRVASAGQEPAGPQAISAASLEAAIDKLGDLDYATRTGAARTVRRTDPAQAVPALLRAVAGHRDGYVRYRALVLLTGFNDPRTRDAMRESLDSPNDRLRTVAYAFFEHHPDPALVGPLLAALDKEQGEFVRPALVRALASAARAFENGAARAEVAKVQQALVRDVTRGEDFFRSVVIEALGDYRAAYAFDAITAVAKLEGPLQDDAALALGKIGDKRALETLAGLQRTAPRAVQPSIAAAICLLGTNCAVHERYIVETLEFADQNQGFQNLLRSAASGLAALGVAGHPEALDALFDVGIPARFETTRAPVALAVGTIALRNTPLFLAVLERQPKLAEAVALVADGFDMLEEDLDKERFFAVVRRTFWDSPEGAPTRALMQTLIGKLDF